MPDNYVSKFNIHDKELIVKDSEARNTANTASTNATNALNRVTEYKELLLYKINELNKRISTIIADGQQTEGNTELIDIRTGADGKVYPTAGDAVRVQIGALSEGNAELKEDLDTLNQGGLNLKEDFIGQQVNEWLDEHPEATTTVQDHSLTINKMVVGTLGYVTPEMFGAEADGITDCTDAFKEILNKDNIVILCKTGTYLIKDVIVASANNIVIFGNNTVIKHDNGTSSNELNNNGFITFNECNNLSLCGVTFDNNAEMVKRVNYGTTGYDEYIYSRKHAYIPLKLVSVEKFIIKNCTFTHGSAGLFVANSKIGSITNCISCDNHADGYFITGVSRNITVSNCKSVRNDDDSFSADGYGDESKSPANIEFVNCIADDCFGALCCLYGSNYTKVLNCIGYNLRYLPFKTGLLKAGDTYLGTSGTNQTIDNCTAYISQKPDGDGSQYMEGGQYSCGALIDGDSNNFVSNISITNCRIINNSGIPFVLLMKYASNVNFSNNTLTGFAIKSKYINYFNFENNQMKLIASLFFDVCSDLVVVGNKASSTNIFNFGIDNVICWCTECGRVVVVGNDFENKVSFYSGGKKSGFKTDENQNPGFVASQTDIQVLGVLYTDNWLSGANYVKGQMILKPDGTLMISDGKSFRNIAIN